MSDNNYKSLLQIHCQKAKVQLPQYSCTQRVQSCNPVFVANLTVLGRTFTSEAEFSSKKQAEKNAAKVALRELGLLDTGEGANTGEPNASQDDQKQPPLATNDGSDGPNPKCVSISAAAEPREDTQPPAPMSSPIPSVAEVAGTLLPVTSTPVSTAKNVSVSFKNLLQERAQKMGLALPKYETTLEGPGFVCTVTFNGQQFKSEGISSNKKLAQQNAASVAVKQLNSEQGTEGNSLLLKTDGSIGILSTASTPEEFASTPEKFDATLSYKNLFQENCQQRGNKPPTYSTSWNGPGFVSFVCFGDKTVSSNVPCTTKKQAEQLAAREALLAIGVQDPENAFRNKGSRKNKSKRTFTPRTGFKRTWVHSHGGQEPQRNAWGDTDYFWEKAVASKRFKLDPTESPAKRGKFEETTFALPREHRQDLTVGEIWKEKKNIVIVGNAESSFILYCTRVPGTCNIFNTRTMSLVLLEPGHRIVGLDACYTDHNGKVALQAERCADVVIPETPDPVLTSCGVVLLYQDPQSSSLQVLLKRYLSSQAFVNVAAALAQYFRRMVSGRPVQLDIQSLTEHIGGWMLEEVLSIAAMHEAALHQLFCHMWKFSKRWCSVLSPPLPRDLELLKARAKDELARRQASDVQHSEDFYHPWSLPKGNFKHRMLSTGLFIEPAVDCAVRELKEETGIKLDKDEVKNSPWLDLLQTDNFNPHKGDMVKYFLYVYQPDGSEEVNMSQESDLGNSSVECEEEQTKGGVEDSFPKFPALDTSFEQEIIKERQDEEDGEEDPHELQKHIQEDSNSLNREMEKDINHEPLQLDQEHVTVGIEQSTCSGIEEALEEKRGIKRKRDDDDDDDYEVNNKRSHETKDNCLLPGISSTPNKCDNSLGSLTTPMSKDKQEVITAKSPYVQGSVHEECAWFAIEEARIKSPVFEQIYHTEQFTQLLASISTTEKL